MSREAAESAMLDARREHYSRWVQLCGINNNLTKAIIVLGLLCIAMGGGMLWMFTQQKIVPFVVEVNGDAEVLRVTRADVAAKPTDNQIMASLRMFVVAARTVFIDRRAQEMQMKTAYSMILAGSPAYTSMDKFHEEFNPYKRSSRETVEVEVRGVPKLSDESFQVVWTETTKSLSGKIISVKHWTGTFKIKIIPQGDITQIGANPFGIYVEWFSWTTRI